MDRPFGLTDQHVAARATVLATAYTIHPERFPAGLPLPPARPEAVWIKPPKSAASEETRGLAATRGRLFGKPGGESIHQWLSGQITSGLHSISFTRSKALISSPNDLLLPNRPVSPTFTPGQQQRTLVVVVARGTGARD